MKHAADRHCLALILLCGVLSAAHAKGPFLLVSGRWDNTILVVDVQKAMDPASAASVRKTPMMSPKNRPEIIPTRPGTSSCA